MSVTDRDEHVYQAKLAEQAERYDEMVLAMKKVAELNVELTVEERNLLSVAYKNVIGARRASWRIISSIEQKEGEKQDDNKKTLIQDYKETIKDDICSLCDEVVDILDTAVVPLATCEESKVFYLKMLGDYQRYKAEVSDGNNKDSASEKSLCFYASASDLSAKLDACNPIRLGLALNQSVFFYEIMGKTDEACKFAKEAINAAFNAMESSQYSKEDTQKDAALIIRLLQDNLELWKDSQDEGDTGDTQLQDVDDDDN